MILFVCRGVRWCGCWLRCGLWWLFEVMDCLVENVVYFGCVLCMVGLLVGIDCVMFVM